MGRGKATAALVLRETSSSPPQLRNVFFYFLCLPLLMPIYYSRRALARRTEEGEQWREEQEWRYCEGGQGGFCSSPAASLLITLRANMKHTHATASSHTHLTSIRHTDGEPILWGDSQSHLSARLREKKRRVGGEDKCYWKIGVFLTAVLQMDLNRSRLWSTQMGTQHPQHVLIFIFNQHHKNAIWRL